MKKPAFLISLLFGALFATPSHADREQLPAAKKGECDTLINSVPAAYNRRKAEIASLKKAINDQKYFEKHLAAFNRIKETLSKTKAQLEQEIATLKKKSQLDKPEQARVAALESALVLQQLFPQSLALADKALQGRIKDPKQKPLNDSETKQGEELLAKINRASEAIQIDAELTAGLNHETKLEMDEKTVLFFTKPAKDKDGKIQKDADGKDKIEVRIVMKTSSEEEKKPRADEKLEGELRPIIRPSFGLHYAPELVEKNGRIVPAQPIKHRVIVKACETFSTGRIRGLALGDYNVLCSRYDLGKKAVLMGADFDSAFNNPENPYREMDLEKFTAASVGMHKLSGDQEPGGCYNYWHANFVKKSQSDLASSGKTDDEGRGAKEEAPAKTDSKKTDDKEKTAPAKK